MKVRIIKKVWYFIRHKDIGKVIEISPKVEDGYMYITTANLKNAGIPAHGGDKYEWIIPADSYEVVPENLPNHERLKQLGVG